MNAKIVQVTVVTEPASGNIPAKNIMVALCEDGTLWEAERLGSGKYSEWINVYERHKSKNQGGMLISD